MTPDELPAFLLALGERKAAAAPDVALAMAHRFHDHVTRVTLRESAHAPESWTSAAPGRPPAYVTGALARSIVVRKGYKSPPLGSAFAGPHIVYARIQEFGGVVRHERSRWLHFNEGGRGFYEREVFIPPRPYMRPAVRDVIRNGSLTRAAMNAFMRATYYGV